MVDDQTADLLLLTAEIVAAHVGHNHIAISDVAGLIAGVHAALAKLEAAPDAAPTAEFPPATTVRKSLANPEVVISMIDGKPYKVLKRHLSAQGLTPAEYRSRYNLPGDYPMTSRAYSEKRGALAKANGLGRKPKAKEPVPAPAEPKRRGPKPK